MLKPALTLLLLATLVPAARAQSAKAPGTEAAPQVREVGVDSPGKVPPSTNSQRRAPRSPLKREILAVQEAGVAKVSALSAAMAGLPEGPALEALHRQVEEAKRETRLSVLRLHLAHAQKNGDASKAAEAQRLIDLMLDPPTPRAADVTRPAPVTDGGNR